MILDEAIAEHDPVAVFGLFSGGHDSLAATAIAAKQPRFTAAVHINTGIGVEETREFVRQTCHDQGWPLVELHPDRKTYEELILESGFPSGPQSHNSMYYWLKQRQVRRLVREHKRDGRPVALVTGIRRSESARRMEAGISIPVRRNGSELWLNPILDWTAVDCGRLIDSEGLERNLVVDLLKRSGECLCGALAARKLEMPELEQWYPQVADRIKALEARVLAAGHHNCGWAQPGPHVHPDQLRLELCHSCESGVYS